MDPFIWLFIATGELLLAEASFGSSEGLQAEGAFNLQTLVRLASRLRVQHSPKLCKSTM
jgi:hypothetical protein